MKKYTKRLKNDFHNWRVIKNWCAIFILLGNALNTLITKGSWETVLSSFGVAVGIIAIGETLHHLGMSWVETAESIQEKKENNGSI